MANLAWLAMTGHLLVPRPAPALLGFFILGHHIDTPETTRKPIEQGFRILLTDIVVTINPPLPGTESYRLVHDCGECVEND